MPGMMDDRDLEEVMAAAHADYAIFWAWGAEQGVLTGAKYASIDGSAMEDSRDFTFKPGEGAVGATWESRQPYFAQDAIGMDTKLFWRAKLATYYRIRSIAMAPRADGVLEVGSRKRWEEPPACLQGGGGGAATTAARQASLVPFEATEEALQRVMSTTGAEYGATAPAPRAEAQARGPHAAGQPRVRGAAPPCLSQQSSGCTFPRSTSSSARCMPRSMARSCASRAPSPSRRASARSAARG